MAYYDLYMFITSCYIVVIHLAANTLIVITQSSSGPRRARPDQFCSDNYYLDTFTAHNCYGQIIGKKKTTTIFSFKTMHENREEKVQIVVQLASLQLRLRIEIQTAVIRGKVKFNATSDHLPHCALPDSQVLAMPLINHRLQSYLTHLMIFRYVVTPSHQYWLNNVLCV